jgi:hypothetical protein
LAVTIHPSKAFSGRRDDAISGGKRVYFKAVPLKEVGSTGEDAMGSMVIKD